MRLRADANRPHMSSPSLDARTRGHREKHRLCQFIAKILALPNLAATSGPVIPRPAPTAGHAIPRHAPLAPHARIHSRRSQQPYAQHAPTPDSGSRTAWAAAAALCAARLRLPGSKSMTNRALDPRGTGRRADRITGPLRARDTLLMAAALRALGATWTPGPRTPARPIRGTAWRVTPGWPTAAARGGRRQRGHRAALRPAGRGPGPGRREFRGDARASQRPVGQLLTALRELGAVIARRRPRRGPVHRQRPRQAGRRHGDAGRVRLVAARLRAAAGRAALRQGRSRSGTEGPRIPSAPHIAMTVQMLRAAGASVETGTRRGGRPARPPGRKSGGCTRAHCAPGPSPSSLTCRMRRRSWPRRWSPAAR